MYGEVFSVLATVNGDETLRLIVSRWDGQKLVTVKKLEGDEAHELYHRLLDEKGKIL